MWSIDVAPLIFSIYDCNLYLSEYGQVYDPFCSIDFKTLFVIICPTAFTPTAQCGIDAQQLTRFLIRESPAIILRTVASTRTKTTAWTVGRQGDSNPESNGRGAGSSKALVPRKARVINYSYFSAHMQAQLGTRSPQSA